MTMWSMLGFFLSTIGPGLIAWLWKRNAAARPSIANDWLYLAAFVALVAGVANIAVWREGLGWRDLGFGQISPASLVTAALLTTIFVCVYGPAMRWSLDRMGLTGFEAGKVAFDRFPRWYLALTVIIVASGEEWLYRAYAIERLEALTGSLWIAAIVSVLAFAAAHIPVWGAPASLAMLPAGAMFTAIYVWQRDIGALILAHIAADLLGLLSTHRREPTGIRDKL